MARRQVHPTVTGRSLKTSRTSAAGYKARSLNAAAANASVVEEAQDVHMCCSRRDLASAKQVLPDQPHAAVKEQEAPFAGEGFVRGLGTVLALWVQESTSAGGPVQIARFHSSAAPCISIQDYIKRLRRYFHCSDECFVLALVYIDKVGKNNPSMAVSDVTVHRLMITALMIAAKFHDDQYYSNQFYSKAGGMTLREVNMLEGIMLKELNWNVVVSVEDYCLYYNLVKTAVGC